MRGLKLWNFIALRRDSVASFTDAWIETMLTEVKALDKKVPSFTDAWIETLCWLLDMMVRLRSHLLQMRGLKLLKVMAFSIFPVASFTDAWIETYKLPK